MKRRKFLTFAGIAAGSLLIPTSIYYISGSVSKYAVLLIKRELNYLKLENGIVEQYVNDYFHNSNDAVTRMKWKTMYYLKLNWEKSNMLKELIKYFLLSTDFFINKMDESKPVKYLGFYSPYKSPVPNPFAYTLYPPNLVANP
ncbi:hypothetical protein [Pedobacter aquatilis]|uniref:hypothetical protein n=1 Tax=Pedobacter aquatilis TaxID=351343 RepID=UPI00292D4C0E|nr:hypothetical protein [Pedobacter aquatilis]